MVKGEHDAVEILSELVTVGIGPELADFDPFSKGRRQDIEPLALKLDQPVTDRPGTIVQLAGGSHEHAASRYGTILGPGHPTLKERPNAWLTPRFLQRWTDHPLDETRRRVFQHLNLKGLFGSEVSEESALGEIEIVSQGANSQAGEAYLAGQPCRVNEN
jgi:hypothetical protein